MIRVPVLFMAIAFLQTCLCKKQPVEYAQKLCRTENDCDWDQCCIDAKTRIPGFKGICSNPTQRGEICNPDPTDKTEEGRYRKACPCDEGLSCQFQKEEEKYNIYECQP